MGRPARDQERIDVAYARYEAALDGRDKYELAAARLGLIRLLIECGWSAPPEAQEQMLRDEQSLRRRAELEAEPDVGPLRPPTHRQPPPRHHR